MVAVSSLWSRLKNLSWKWQLLLAFLIIAIVVAVIVPGAIYLSRNRDVPDYSEIQPRAEMSYLVSYDSGDGMTNESKFTLKVAEPNMLRGNETCSHTITVIDPYPKRKVNAIIFGSIDITRAANEIWYSEDDRREVYRESMYIDLPLVNTVVHRVTYSGYEGYTGWPYHLGDRWTYDVFNDPDTNLQSDWTDSFSAEVVADNEIINLNGIEYECFKVVHTLVATTNDTPPGKGIGSTYVEYWAKSSEFFAPIKYENSVDYRGTESWIMTEIQPLLPQ